MSLKLIKTDWFGFEALRENGRLKAMQAYELKGAFGQEPEYAFSPDGEGVFWYDTYEEMVAQHA
jgi:hypothetical protein